MGHKSKNIKIVKEDEIIINKPFLDDKHHEASCCNYCKNKDTCKDHDKIDNILSNINSIERKE